MTAIVIDEPYPQELILKNAAALVVEDGLTLLVHMDKLQTPDHDFAETPGDLEAFRGPVKIHLARFNFLPWLAVEFPLTRLVYDTPVVVGHEDQTKQDLFTMIEEKSNRLIIYVLEGPQYIVRVIRVMGLSHDIIGGMRPALMQPDGLGEIHDMVESGQRWFPDSQAVVERATVHQEFPWQ